MKRFCIILVLVVAQVSSNLWAAATSRGFTSSQVYTPGGNPGTLWFSQPLPSSSTNQAKKVSLKQPLEKGVKNVPPPPPPKPKTVVDSRPIYDKPKVDNKKVEVKSKVDNKPLAAKIQKSKTVFDTTSYNRIGNVPNAGNRTIGNVPGIFTPVPPPKQRHHGLGDWP